MTDTVFLYISAASDLESERDFISRAVTEIPVPMGWRIVQTPLRGEPVDLEAVARADFHILLLGSDIRAPIGQEWLASRRAGRTPVLFLKGEIARTPAGESFQRHIAEAAAWRVYKDLADLRGQVFSVLAGHFFDRTGYYRLSLEELARLQEWQKVLEKSQGVKEPVGRSVAGDSSVILSTERYVPSEGVLLKPAKKSEPEG